jgi:hypothetical protein
VKDNLRRFVRLFPSNKDKLKVVTLCVLAATTFWFFSALNKSDYTTLLEYPVTFLYQDDSTYVLEGLPEHILVEVRGGGWNLLRKTLLLDSPPIEINLEDPINTRYITGESLSQQITEKLGEVQLDNVVTDTLFFRIDRAAQKEVQLVLDSSSIRLSNSYQIISPITLSTEKAMVQGPETILEDIGDTLFVTIPDQDISEDYEQAIPLEYSTSDMVSIEPEILEVSFSVAAFEMVTKSVDIQTLYFPEDSSLAILPNRVDVSFWIQDKYIDLIQDYDFEVIANLRSLNIEDSTITPTLESYPKFAKDIKISPAKVSLQNVE